MKNAAIAILAILTVLFGIYGFMQSTEASRQAELAMQHERRTLEAEKAALAARDVAEMMRQKLAECEMNKSK